MEICRPPTASPAQDLAQLARDYVAAGADALAVRVDYEDTPEGLKDLYVVCQAVKVPVLARDWVIHPLQVSRRGRCVRPACAGGPEAARAGGLAGWRAGRCTAWHPPPRAPRRWWRPRRPALQASSASYTRSTGGARP
jgi:hypothetical protein